MFKIVKIFYNEGDFSTGQVSNNDIAFRYELPTWGNRKACVVEKEKLKIQHD